MTDKKAMAPSRSDPQFVNDNPTVYDLYDLGKEMMNQAGWNLGTLSVGGPEDCKFRSFFGSGVTVILLGGINFTWGVSDSLSLGLDVYENIQLRNCFVWACGWD